MATSVKGDRESKQNFVRGTLDQAFTDRVSVLFNDLCNDLEVTKHNKDFHGSIQKRELESCWNTASEYHRHPAGI